MNSNSSAPAADSPILVVPYMWIGDFVRCHSVVRLLKARYPQRPVDLLTTTLCRPLVSSWTVTPTPAASIMMPMMLLALTRRSPRASQTSQG